MATNVNFECFTEGYDGRGGRQTGTISLADVVVNTSPNTTGGWNTATVTADKQQRIFVSATDGLAQGIEPGWYEKVSDSPNLFRKQPAERSLA